MNESQYRLVKVIIAFIVLVILFLMALNNRYYIIDEDLMIDKWTKELIFIN